MNPVRLGDAPRALAARQLRNHPDGDRAPDAIARLALIRDEVGVIAMQKFVAVRFDLFCH